MPAPLPETSVRESTSTRFCPYCGAPFHDGKRARCRGTPSSRSWDHVLPRERGGRNEPDNYRRVCLSCNELRAFAGHCVGALACARAVAGGYPLFVLRRWFGSLAGDRLNASLAAAAAVSSFNERGPDEDPS